MSTQLATKDFFNQNGVKAKFEELLGKRSSSFITSVLQVTTSNDLLAKADAHSIYSAAITAAVMDLPINNNLGFAYIVPFGGKAQFQIGYKGLIQLCQRTGKYETISIAEIYEGQLVSENPLTGYIFDFTKKSDVVIGYAAYFKLLDGFHKTLYWDKEKCEKHAKQYSQTYKKGFGNWKDNFDAMAKKTVLKSLLSTFAPLSIEIQTAIIEDQKVDGEYKDNLEMPEPIQSEKFANAFNSITDAEVVTEEMKEDEQK